MKTLISSSLFTSFISHLSIVPRYLQRLARPLLLLLLAGLTACAWLGKEDAGPEPEPTLADLRPARMPDSSIELPRVGLDELTSSYRSVLESDADADVRDQVLGRLAGLEMLRSEQKLYEQQTNQAVFGDTIEAYQELLASQPDRPGNDNLLYQLSKAYDLNRQPQESLTVLNRLVSRYPHTKHYVEAQFRRAESYFIAGDYATAEKAYQEVISRGAGSSYYKNALYMHGWTQFKRDRYRASLKSFTGTLDHLVPVDNRLDSLDQGQKGLAQDSFRVMSLVFSYLEGAETIRALYRPEALGRRHYEPLLYDNLGQLYLGQERYRDSADAYRAFIDEYPQHDLAPTYSGKRISAFEQGDFPAEVLAEKEDYVKRYGIRSDFWAAKTEPVREQIRPFLRQYITELAQHYHAGAQQLAKAKIKNRKRAEAQRKEAKAFFGKAAGYYQSYVNTFPEDEKVPEMTFLMAEARFEAGDFEQAIFAYETVAYDLFDGEQSGYKRAAEAGYSAILSYQEQLKQTAADSRQGWTRLKIESELRFAYQFADDKRAPVVLAQAAEELLKLDEYEQAVSAAQKLTGWQPALGPNLRRTAWLVTGHSQFELKRFAEAEQAYLETLKLTAPKAAARGDLNERLAATVYKQGEQALAAGDRLAAAEQFLRVSSVAPGAGIVVNAQYDAAVNLLAAKVWNRAIEVLNDFRRRYPKHKLTRDIPAQLVLAYQENRQWQEAADELSAIHAREADPDKKRQALYLTAELFEKAGNKPMAIDRYRSYAHTYHQPFPAAMEARFRLSELYLGLGEGAKRRYWLKKMIAAHQEQGKGATDRSRYLAAFSSAVFADDAFNRYARIKLSLPLKSSLRKKRKALNQVLAAYQKTIDYGLEEFATKATFKIGAIYANLSKELLASERPKKLDALALEQYQILLEEQAFPFEEKAIAIHEGNARRSWNGIYDEWIQQSFNELGKLLPARYLKLENKLGYSDGIY